MRRFLIFLAMALSACVFGGAALVLQDEAQVQTMPPPSPQDVAATRELVRSVRMATRNAGETPLATDAAQLNSAMRLGARFINGFRGQVTVQPDGVRGNVSVPVPWWRGQKWINLSGHVPPFRDTPVLNDVRIGHLHLPSPVFLALLRTGGNLGVGEGFGDKMLQSVTAMTVAENDVTFQLAIDEIGKNGLMQSAFGTLRGAEMPPPAEIEGYHQQIRAAMAGGALPQEGSFLPYVRFTLQAAYENSEPDKLANAYTAAIFGLAKACGAKDFAMIVGRLAFDVAGFEETWPTSCEDVTFNGRIDSRRHFITSAALQAASNRGFSVSVGEFKELFDTISGAGGFDFTDMAANLSGIRLSNVMMQTPRADWPAQMARIDTERDVIPSFDGIPHLMPDTEFEARFTDVDSPAYHQMIADIEHRIDALRLYQEK
jgi:hypothetical protein